LPLVRAPFLFGWAKPVPVNWANLRIRRATSSRSLAGPASNLLLAIAFAGLARIAPATGF
jgi:Zn-dependent protease